MRRERGRGGQGERERSKGTSCVYIGQIVFTNVITVIRNITAVLYIVIT